MNLIFIGAGALGGLFALKASLQNSGTTIAVVSPRRYKSIRENGFIMVDLDGNQKKSENLMIVESVTSQQLTSADFLIISSKTYSISSICQQYKNEIPSSLPICLLQNGLGNEELVQQIFPHNPIYRLISSNGAMLNEDGIITHTGQAPSFIGLYTQSQGESQHLTVLTELFCQSGIPIEISNKINSIIWEKAFINIGINVFGALTRLNNGSLLDLPSLNDLMKKTVYEAYYVAISEKVELREFDFYWNQVLKILSLTSQNKNSMLQDILNRKPTEIDFLNGKISQKGLILGVKTPFNNLLTNLVKGLEFSYLSE